MEIRFADSRPTGDYALVLPVAGKDRKSLGTLAAAQQAIGAPGFGSEAQALRPFIGLQDGLAKLG